MGRSKEGNQGKPSFAAWAGTAAGIKALDEIVSGGGDVLSGVCEEGSLEERTFLIFDSWDQVHAMEELVDLDTVEYGFSDEYSRCGCGRCNVAVRVSPDSYGWRPYFLVTAEGPVLLEHASPHHVDEYVAERINRHDMAVNLPGLDLTLAGFRELRGGYESGFHEGQTDDPKAILRALRERNPNASFLFVVDDVGQFDTSYGVWVRGEMAD